MQPRAYSLFEIKSVDAEKRIIEGIASTPEPDRIGDVMDSKGAKFSLPMPFLWMHRQDSPIGEVFEAKVTSAGIAIKARIAQIEEDGPLKERLDLAWQTMKAKLVKGLSIGWRPIKEVYNHTRGGFDYPEWDWYELSAVTVPMNASATISNIKSIDAEQNAAPGDAASKTTPGASGSSRAKTARTRSAMAKKTYAEQITDIKAQIDTKQSDLEAIQTKVTDEGRTKDAEEREQFNTLSAEVKALEDELADLEGLEARAKAAAKPVPGSATFATVPRGGAPGGFQHVQVKANRDPGIGFARAVICKAAAFLSQGSMNAIDIAKQRYAHDPEIEMFLKTAVAGGTTVDSTWASPLAYASLANEFVEYLRPQTIIGKFGTTVNGVTYPSLQRLPFNVKINRETAGATAYWVGEGKPKPVSKGAFDQLTLAYTKVAAISVITQELARFSTPSAEAYVRNALAKAVIARIDTDFIDPAKAVSNGVNPASITNGVTTVGASAGTSADNARTDLIKLLNAYIINNQNVADLVLIMPNSLAMALSVLTTSLGTKQFPTIGINGGSLEGIPVITSQYAGNLDTYGNMVIAVDASAIGVADDGEVSVDVSTEASLQMLDNPTNSMSDGTPTTMVSLWQTNSIGLRAERFINWVKLRSTAVQWYDDINWGSVGSPG